MKREYTATETQTYFCRTQDQEIQTRSFADKLVQTEIKLPLSCNYDDVQLAAFLKSAYGIIEEEFMIQIPRFTMDVDEMISFGRCKKLYEVTESPVGIDDKRMRVTLLLWKKERSIIYVGYSSEHTEWCNHSGYVRMYYFQEKDIDLRFFLLNELVASSCVTCMDVHPFIPYILAGGTFSGEVILWNTNKTENNTLATSYPYSSIGNDHKEAVSQILWMRNAEAYDRNPMLITSGLDGVLILWQYAPLSEEIVLYARVVLHPEYHRKGIKTNLFGIYDSPLKITCFSISAQNPLTVVAGMDGGHVFCLSINAVKENKTVTVKGESFIVVMNPVMGRYQSHAASVTDVQHMKFEIGDVERFATAGLDRCIKIFKACEEEPIFIFYCDEVIFGLFYWDLDPTKLVAWGCNEISVYDVPSGKKLGSPTFDEELKGRTPTTSITSNGHHIFLIGKVNGAISAWKLMET